MDESLLTDQERRWRAGDPTPVEAYLQRAPELMRDSEGLAALICGEIRLRTERGESPRWEDYAARYPSCAAALARRLFAPADSVSAIGPNYETIVPEAARSTPPDADGGRYETLASVAKGDGSAAARVLNLGRPEIPGFEILNELGRGGMGIVYRARQLSADRIVALKVVRNDVLDSLPFETRASTLDRFRSEAQAAANLDHDNLVTVFEVGESNGVCYYAMRYVEGRSLFDMLKGGPLDQRLAATYLEPVARALHMAHQRGILHRDLKPHNILVDERTNRPLLADFGLAKIMQKSHDITHAGELLGTPSYMSPEQACDAAHVTASADIYSLGATLYHLVTARPPFQAASLTETIRQITSQEPVSPRQLNSAIDRDLETICVKCLQKEPARRYESAEALADDLRRYLEGRPIVARPLNWLGRAWRWCRRNPVPAAWISIAATFALVSVVAILVGYARTAAALAVSRRHLQQTVGAVNELFTIFGDKDLKDEPGMQPIRVLLLKKAKGHLKTLLEESGDDPLLRDYIAETRFLVGVAEMEDDASTRPQAFVELLEASRMQRSLLRETPVDAARQASRTKALAASLNALGYYRMTDARKVADEDFASVESSNQVDALCEDAERLFQETRDLRQVLVNADRTNIEYQRLLASAAMNLGICAENRSYYETMRGKAEASRAQEKLALDYYHAAQRIRQAARDRLSSTAERSPTATLTRELEEDLGKGDFQIARLRWKDPGSESEVVEHLRSAIRHFEQVAQIPPLSLANRYRLGRCHSLLGARLVKRNEFAAAWESLEQAAEFLYPLAMGNPTVSEYQSELAELCLRRGLLKRDQNDLVAAERELLEACRVLDRSLKTMKGGDSRQIHPVRMDLERARFKLARVQMSQSHWKAALESLALAEEAMQSVIRAGSGDSQCQYERAQISLTRGRALSANHEDDAAEKEWLRTREIIGALLRDDGRNEDARLSQAQLNRELGSLQVRRKAWPEALPPLEAARDELEQLHAEVPEDAEFSRELAATLEVVAQVRRELGQADEAAQAQTRAQRLLAELESGEPPATEDR